MNLWTDTYLPDILHGIAQSMLVPTVIVVIALIAVCLFFLGQVIVEYLTERRHFRQDIAEIINAINDASYDGVAGIIASSGLLRIQKRALLLVARNMGLPEEALFSLAESQIARVNKHYQGRLAWTDTLSKIAPMLGLMGTLIPLGPGIVAMGEGRIETLSDSLEVAFDATVCGLVIACVSIIISKVRSRWYQEYMSTLESLVGCILEKADTARKEGVKLPANFTGDPPCGIRGLEGAFEEGSEEDRFAPWLRKRSVGLVEGEKP